MTNTGQGTQVLTNVAISIKNADGSAWSSDAVDPLLPVCDATDFSIGQEPVGVAKTDATLAGPFTAGQARSSAVTVQMINKPGANQDNCKGVSVPLYFSAS